MSFQLVYAIYRNYGNFRFSSHEESRLSKKKVLINAQTNSGNKSRSCPVDRFQNFHIPHFYYNKWVR